MNSLAEILNQEIRMASQLKDFLYEEREILSENRLQELAELLPKKAELLQHMAQADQQRTELLKQMGVQGNEAIAEHCSTHSDQRISGLWAQLNELANECRNENRINGGAIQLASRRNEELMNLLFAGNQAQNNTYDASGKTRQNSGRSIAKA